MKKSKKIRQLVCVCGVLAIQSMITGCQVTSHMFSGEDGDSMNSEVYTEKVTNDTENTSEEITSSYADTTSVESTEVTIAESTEEISAEQATEKATEKTAEKATENAVEKTTDDSIETGVSDNSSPWFDDSQSQRVQCVRGNIFYVPAGFEQIDQRPTSGYMYKYYNDKLDMTITVWDTTLYYLPYDNGDDFLDSNIPMYEGYENYSVTYSDRGENYVVVSGYDAWGKVYYDMFTMQGENKDLVFEVKFEYGTERKDECDKLVAKFLDSIVYAD